MNASTVDGQKPDGRTDGPTDGPVATPTVETLVADYLPEVYRDAFRLSGALGDDEDLSQQAFLIAQQRP
mgnify:FL=1